MFGEARPPGVAKYKATTESKLAESCGELPDVAKSVEKFIWMRKGTPIWHGCHCRELPIGRTSQVGVSVTELTVAEERWRKAAESVCPPRAFKPCRSMMIG